MPPTILWWDALGNYLTALGYGTASADHQRWWTGAERRVHLLGKGVLRFHAVYWPAMLLSAGEPLPTDILVHDYLTAAGRKLSKSAGVILDPAELAARYGTDAVRWWLLREVPRVGDADFTPERLVHRADDELANGLGNLVNRTVAMVHRYRDGQVPSTGGLSPEARPLDEAIRRAPDLVDAALDGFDFRRATAAVWEIVGAANRYVNQVRPWELARAERAGDEGAGRRLDAVLAALVRACREVAGLLEPFLPDASARIAAQCATLDGRLPAPSPVFPKLGGTRLDR